MARRADTSAARTTWLLGLLVAMVACEGGPAGGASDSNAEAQGGALSPCVEPECAPRDEDRSGDSEATVPQDRCETPVPVFEDGRVTSHVCERAAAEAGLTVLDLSDDWAPRILGGGPEGPVPYRETYVKMANEQFGDDPVWDRARHDRYLELYGIFPTFSVVRGRLLDEERHACHAAVDDAGLESLRHGVDTWKPVAEQRGDLATLKLLEGRLKAAAARLGLEGIDAFASANDANGAYYAKYRKILTRDAGIRAMKAHLRCEGLYEGEHDGLMDGAVIEAMQAFHRRHMIVSWQLDEETKQALMADTRELDFLTMLRALRERVVDATGLLEDGTAAGVVHEVVGRKLDTAVFLDDSRGAPLDAGAPDRVGAATDAAARALGWTSPAAVRALFENGELPALAAVRLPPPPDYHSPHMSLRIIIDRGDVWYDFPFTGRGDRFVMPRTRKPSVIVFTEHDGDVVPLTRWPTTIGGWQPEKLNGRTMLMYKESPAGARVVRDIVAAPRWVPPSSTPTRDLLRPRGRGVWVPKYDAFGPHYASAYGIAMMIHHRIDQPPGGEPIFTDQGIRTHGSASYDSILDGFSHGCHRVHNHRAVRLTGFLLAHRDHVVRGPLELDFHRTLHYQRNRHQLHFDSRGYRYELTPPVEVEVLRGRVMGSAAPPAPRGLPEKLLRRYGFGG